MMASGWTGTMTPVLALQPSWGTYFLFWTDLLWLRPWPSQFWKEISMWNQEDILSAIPPLSISVASICIICPVELWESEDRSLNSHVKLSKWLIWGIVTAQLYRSLGKGKQQKTARLYSVFFWFFATLMHGSYMPVYTRGTVLFPFLSPYIIKNFTWIEHTGWASGCKMSLWSEKGERGSSGCECVEMSCHLLRALGL